jgi:hypothetical protein
VTVSDTSTVGTPERPYGRVTFTAAGAGSFAKPASCSFKRVSASSASCSISYTPQKTGSRVVVAMYPGDKVLAASKGSVKVKIDK